MKIQLDRVGTAGMVLTALLSPCCFPLFGFAFTSLGFGSVELFGGWTMWIFQLMILISLFGFFISYRQHQFIHALVIAVPSSLLIFYAYHFNESHYWIMLLYIGMFGLMIATGINFYSVRRRKTEPILKSTITCPQCGHKKKELMPTDACVYFYDCENCKTVLKAKDGDCCVYCSYGTVQCPPMQLGLDCC